MVKVSNYSKFSKSLWSFLQRFSLDYVFFLREKNLSSVLLDVDGFSRLFLLKILDFLSEPWEFLVFVLSTVSLADRGRKTKFFSRDQPNWLCEAQKLKKFSRRTVKIKNLKQKKDGKSSNIKENWWQIFFTEVEPRNPGINGEEEAFFRAGKV